jgi:hypothetical protein
MKLIYLLLLAIVATNYVNINFGDIGNFNLVTQYTKENELYEIKDGKCIPKSKLLVLSEFHRLMKISKDYICKANKVTLLGDQVYVNDKVESQEKMDPEYKAKNIKILGDNSYVHGNL